MTKLGNDKVKELIAEMSHYDPDNMEMAAKRISELILNKEINLEEDSNLANSVQEAFMKQIESENDTVQSEAIKYLADIVPSLPSSQVELIYQKILQHITHLEESEKKRERYGACAATVIHQAAEEYGSKLGNLFLKSIEKLLQHQDKKIELEIILINIITEFLRKWPNVAARLHYDRRGLLLYLLRNVQTKTKLDIIKKSESCLGKLALILERDLVNLSLNDPDWGLLRFITRNSSKPTVEALKQARNGLLCLSQLLKSHNIELRFWAKEMAHLLLNTVNQFKGSDDIDNIEVTCDILDASLTALSFIIRTFSRELREEMSVPRSPYSAFLRELLEFNVEGMMTYAGEEMPEEGYEDDYDGYYEQAEADEKCWKVRRAVLYYISFLARYDKHFLESLEEGELIQDLGSKLVEEHSMVSEMGFHTFNELIELISIDRALTSDEVSVEELSLQRVKSSAKEIADRIIKEISSRVRVILNNSKFNDQLKSESAKILLKLIQIYNHHLIANEDETFQLVAFLTQELRRTTIAECRVSLLQSLRELVSDHYPLPRYQPVLDYCFEAIAKGSVKIQNICLLTIRKFLHVFPRDIGGRTQDMERVLGLMRGKVGELDSDKAIKVAICRCLAVLFEHYRLGSKDLVFFLDGLAHKLKIEVEKIYIIDTLARFGKQHLLDDKAYRSLENVIRQTGESLGSSNYELNLKAVETIDHLLGVMGKHCSSKLMEELLDRSKLILGEGKIPSFISHIGDHQPKLLKPYAELIVKSTESKHIVALIYHQVINLNSCMAILKTIDQDRAKKVSETIGAIHLAEKDILREADETPWGRVMVVALGYVGTHQTLPALYRYLEQFKSDEAKNDVCSAIGNILSKDPDQLLPAFLGKNSPSADVYISLCIIKEMLGFTKKAFSSLSYLIEWLFSKSEQKLEAESNYYIISECIGRLAFLDSNAVGKVIENGQAGHPHRRLVVASSLRFALENEAELDEGLLNSYIEVVVKLMGDEKVNVREGAVKSLTTVGQCHSRGVREFAQDRSFWESIIRNCRINDSLITIIDYGLCKEVKDEGKNLRLESFNLLQLLTKKVPIETYIIEEGMEATLHRINDENSNDIVLKRLTVIRSLCQLDFSPFIRLQNDFIARVNPKDGLLKKYEKGLSEERLGIYLKGILKEIWEINNLAKEEHVDKLGELMVELRNSPIYQPLLEQLQAPK